MSPTLNPTHDAGSPAQHGTPWLRRLRSLTAGAARHAATMLVRSLAAWLAGRRAASAADPYLARAADAQDLQVRLNALERVRP